jgi:hypothetical protein
MSPEPMVILVFTDILKLFSFFYQCSPQRNLTENILCKKRNDDYLPLYVLYVFTQNCTLIMKKFCIFNVCIKCVCHSNLGGLLEKKETKAILRNMARCGHHMPFCHRDTLVETACRLCSGSGMRIIYCCPI